MTYNHEQPTVLFEPTSLSSLSGEDGKWMTASPTLPVSELVDVLLPTSSPKFSLCTPEAGTVITRFHATYWRECRVATSSVLFPSQKRPLGLKL